MSLKKIIGIGSLVILGCLACTTAKKQTLVVPLPGTVEKNATYVVQAYVNKATGFCDKYKVIGPGMSEETFNFSPDEEIPATEIQHSIEGQKGLVDYIDFY